MDSRPPFRLGVPVIAACAALLAAAPAQAATSLGQAEKKALDALGVKKSDDPVLVLRQRKSLKAGTVVRQAGPAKPADGKPSKLGVRRAKARVALRVPADERAWMFYADEAPFQAYQHPGRIVLVGIESGTVQTSKTLQWPPVIRGKLPRFMRSAEAYRDPANRIFYRFWDADPAKMADRRRGAQQRSLGEDRFGAASQSVEQQAQRQRAADNLAEERSCVIRFGETLGNFYDFASVSRSVVGFGGLFNGLERLNPGFRSSRYGVKSGRSPLAYVQRAIDRGNCRDVMFYLAGSGYKGSNVVNFGLRPQADGTVEVHELSARQLRRFTRANPTVTFKLIADAPYAGGFAKLVAGEPNVLITQTPGQSAEPSFRFIPGILHRGEVVRNLGNSMGLLEFTNQLRIGFNRFFSSKREIDHAERQGADGTSGRRLLADGDSSFLVWGMGRAFDGSQNADFAGLIGLTNAINRIKDSETPSRPPGSNPAVNHAPVANGQTLNAVEDVPRSITLSGSDPDGNPIGYTVVEGPAHGTLSGTAPNLTYTPASNFNGADSFKFTVTDGTLTSAPATISLDVAAANDAPVATSSSGSTAFTENAAATAVDGGLTVTDIDSANLTGATVKVADGFTSDDVLAMPSQAGITAAYNQSTGVLTLSGSDTVANYQAALRAVTFRHTGDDPTPSRRIDFSVKDASLDSAVTSKTVQIGAVNDVPVENAANSMAAYVEGDPAVPVDPALTVTDADDDQMTGATVQITTNHAALQDVLAFANTATITGTYDAVSGKLTLSGTASTADYQAAVRTVTYENSSSNPSTATRTLTFTVTDASGGTSVAETRDLSVASNNNRAAVTTSAGSTAYTEGAASAPIDGALTVGDPDDTNLEGATVAISTNLETGDELVFTNQSGITGNYSAGVLTLTGSASLSDYQAALRSVGFRNTADDDLQSPKTIQFRADDGDGAGPLATKDIAITAVNDAPALSTTGGSASYAEGGVGVAIDGGLTVTDPDSANLAGATVQITTNFSAGQDSLAFAAQNGITGAYNSGTGTLTLSGSASLANYQTALRSVTYSNSSDDPSTATRTVRFQVDDGAGANNLSNVATRDVTVSASNDAPVVTASGGSTAHTEGGAASTVDGSVTVTDADDTNLEGGQVRISSGFQSGDDLVFVNQNGISGVYNTGTGVLTLTGTASKADYQTALRSVQFRTTNDNPATSKTVEFKVNDGDVDSNLATKSVGITPVNDAPTATTTAAPLGYTEGDGAVVVDSGLTLTDPDSTQVQGATVQITGNFISADDELAFATQNGITGSYNDTNGTLTLSGTASLANYQAALRSVTYANVSDNPSGSKTVSFQATDAEGAASNVATRTVNLSGANDAPVVTASGGSTAHTEGGAASTVDGSVTVTDADDTNLEGGQVRISSGFQSGDDLVFVNQNGISGVYNTGTGVLTLTGTASKADYQTALRSVQFRTTNDDPVSSKTVEFKVNDGDVDSNLATKTLAIAPVNDAPTTNTTGSALSYTEGDGAVAVDSGLTLTDPDSTQAQGATVQLTGNFVQADDELAFSTQNGITGSYNDTNGTLTLSGTTSLANYQTALRSVTYANVSDNPSGSKTVSFQATDAEGAASNVASRTINLTGANDAPVLANGGTLNYTENDAATQITSTLTVSDADDTHLESASASVTSGHQASDDLSWVDNNAGDGITLGSDNNTTDVLTLTGTGTLAEYQAALRAVKYENTGNNPTGPKQVTFVGNDGSADSNGATVDINITGQNDAPLVNLTDANMTYNEGAGPVAIDPGATVDDADDAAVINRVTVEVTTNWTAAQDDLAWVDNNGSDAITMTGDDDAAGVLVLSGDGTEAQYEAALRAVTYENNSQSPSPATRVVSVKARDASNAEGPADTRTIDVNSIDDAPVVTTTGGPTSYTERAAAVTVDSGITVSDQDDVNLDSGQVRISSGFQSGDSLHFVNTANITGNYTAGTGVLTLTGTDTVANYQTALRSITFSSTNTTPVASKTVEFKVNDGDSDSNTPTKEITVTATNDAPVVTSGGTLSYTENDPATAVHSGLTITEGEGDDLWSGSASITANYAAGQDDLNWTDNNLADNITQDNVNTNDQTIVLTGVDTAANYQAALRAVTYTNTSSNPTSSNRTVTFSATDAPGLTGSDTRTISVSAGDDPPTGVNDSATVLEDAAATSVPVLTNDTDPDGGPKTISSAGDPANGTVVLTGGSPGAHTGLTYQPDPNYCNDPPGTTPDTFTYTLNGGSVATVSMTVTCVNEAPSAVADNYSTSEDTQLNVAAPGVLGNDTDPDSGSMTAVKVTDPSHGSVTVNANGSFTYDPDPNFNGADSFTYKANDGSLDSNTATVNLTVNAVNDAPSNTTPGAQAVDEDTNLAFNTGNGNLISTSDVDAGSDPVKVTLSALHGSLTLNGTTGLSFACGGCAGDGTADSTMTFTGTLASVNTALNGLSYRATLNYDGPDQLSLTVNDQGSTGAGGAKQDSDTIGVTVNPVNDNPVATDETFNSTSSAIANTTLNVNNTATRNGTTDGRLATPDPTDTSPTVNRPHKEITGDILANDTDADNNNDEFTVVPGTFATNDGGTVTIQSDGDFNFEPAPSTSCTDTSDFFDYTVTDNVSFGSGPNPGTDTGRVTIAITGCVWYVNNNDAQGNNGTSEKPFDTTAQAQTASGNGHTTFVYDGDDTTTGYNTGYTMNTNESLISEGATLTIGSDTLHSADAANKASVTNNNADVVTLAGGATVKSLNIDPQGTGGGIFGTGLGSTTVTLDDLNVVDNGTKGTQPGLELDTNTGTTTNVSNLTVSNGDGSSATTGDVGVKLNATGTVNFASTGTISITTNGAAGLDAAAGAGTTSLGSAGTFDAITVTSSGNGGVKLAGTTGSGTAFGDGTGNDLQLTTVSGSSAAFSAQTAGSFSVPLAGQSDIHATGGPAVDVTTSSGSTMPFDDVDSTNSANDGINLDGLGTGTFSATSGDVGGYSGIGFDLNGGSGAITYPATFSNGSGPLVSEITGRTGGVISLSGNLNDTNDAGGGINLSGNTGGSTVFSGATKQFNTGASDALTVSNPDGGTHTAVWSGGGTDVDTTSGNGVSVSGVGPTADGNIQFSGSGNTLNATALGASNRAFNVIDTNITATGATFDSISSSGGANGIRVSNTGTAGKLTVTGFGGTCQNGSTAGCSGGTIASTTGADDTGTIPAGTGIVLNNTTAPSFTRMWVHDHTNYGIRGNDVNGFVLANSVVNATAGFNGNNASTDEGSVSFDELLGTGVAITDSAIMQGWENDLRIKNDSGTLNRLTVSGTRFGSASTEHNDSIQIEGNVSSVLNATVTGSTFTSARGDQFQAVIQDNATGDIQFTSNTITNSHSASAGGGVLVAAGGNGDMTYAMNSNSINGAKGSALVAEKLFGTGTNDGTIVGTISGNTIGTAGVASSGSENGSGIFLRELGRGRHSVQVTNNTLRGYRDHGIALFAGGAPTSSTGLPAHDGALNLTITGNNVAQPNGTGAGTGGGIYLQAGTNSPDAYDVCVTANNNTINGSAPLALGSTDFLMFQRFDTRFFLPGYTGVADGTVTPDLNSYFHPRFVGGVTANGGNTTTQYIVNTASATGGYFNTAGGAPCPTN